MRDPGSRSNESTDAPRDPESRPGAPASRESPEQPPIRIKSGFSRADLRTERLPEGDAIVKDFRGKGLLFRRWIGPWLLDREQRAYERLCGLDGFPAWQRRLDRAALAVARVEGTVLSREIARRLGRPFFDRLQATVDAMHDRGVVHFDLHQKRNILVTDDGRPVLIDFASAIRFAPGRLSRPPLCVLKRPDRMAVLKFKARLPELKLTPACR